MPQTFRTLCIPNLPDFENQLPDPMTLTIQWLMSSLRAAPANPETYMSLTKPLLDTSFPANGHLKILALLSPGASRPSNR